MEQAQGTSTSSNTRTGCAKKRNYFITFWNMNYPRELPNNATYLVTCEDKCPETGTIHGHAFIYFKNPITLTGVKKLFGNDCHVERYIHSNSDCIKYVKGEIHDDNHIKSNILEHGTMPMDNGKHRIHEIINNYDNITDIMENEPQLYCQYRNGIKDLMENKNRKNRFIKPPIVIWTYGPTGTGKTDEAFNAGARNVDYNNGFFTDWGNDRIISLEEMNGQIPYKTLLKLTDQYHNYYEVNIKNGSKLVDLDVIYITSSKHPIECYPNQCERDSIKQLLRRITSIKCTDPNYAYNITC